MTNDRYRLLLQHLEDHHPGELAHGERVAVYSVATAEVMGVADVDLALLRHAAGLHDIGKLDLPATLIGKREQLDGQEVLDLRRHSEAARAHLDGEPFMDWVTAHHERWDGTGYPNGLAGDATPLCARIIAVAETFDVLLNDNRYRQPLDEDAALGEIRRCAGTQFDPAVVEAFLGVQPLIQPLEVA